MKNSKSLAINSKILQLNNVRAYLFESLFIILAASLPSICHLLDAPVRYILPMHWTVILAGLVYGWKGGAIAGLLSPVVSFLITGMPFLVLLTPMTAELVAYGLIAGILIEKVKLNPFASIAISLLTGRIIFLLSIILLNQGTSISGYFIVAMLPGIITGLIQIISLPFVAKYWRK
jgi:hypothetical protein